MWPLGYPWYYSMSVTGFFLYACECSYSQLSMRFWIPQPFLGLVLSIWPSPYILSHSADSLSSNSSFAQLLYICVWFCVSYLCVSVCACVCVCVRVRAHSTTVWYKQVLSLFTVCSIRVYCDAIIV